MTSVPAPTPHPRLGAAVFGARDEVEERSLAEQTVETDRLMWSEKTYRIFGTAPHEFDGTYHSFLKQVHPDNRQALNQVFEEALAGKSRYGYRLHRQDGAQSLIQGEGEAHLVLMASSAWSAPAKDVTEREEERLALRESEARFRSLTGLSTDWHWEQDDQLRFTEFADGRHAQWDRNRREIIGEVPLGNCRLRTARSDWGPHRV